MALGCRLSSLIGPDRFCPTPPGKLAGLKTQDAVEETVATLIATFGAGRLVRCKRPTKPFNYPQVLLPKRKPRWMSLSFDRPRHMTMFPGGGSEVRLR